jgi:Flp pilus assembly protein TadG
VVELAFVMPLFIFLIFGQIESARLGMVAQLLTTGAREGCRVAVINGNTNTDVTNQVNTFLNVANITGVTTTQVPTDCTTVHATDNPNTITLTLSVPYSQVSWLPSPFFLKTATITATAVLSSERP